MKTSLEVAYATATFPVTSVFTRWPSYLSSRLRSSGLLSARILSGLGCGRPRATCHCLSRYTSEQSTCNSRRVGRVQLFVDNVKVYEVYGFELETAQFSPRQPYVIEERLPTDVDSRPSVSPEQTVQNDVTVRNDAAV